MPGSRLDAGRRWNQPDDDREQDHRRQDPQSPEFFSRMWTLGLGRMGFRGRGRPSPNIVVHTPCYPGSVLGSGRREKGPVILPVHPSDVQNRDLLRALYLAGFGIAAMAKAFLIGLVHH